MSSNVLSARDHCAINENLPKITGEMGFEGSLVMRNAPSD